MEGEDLEALVEDIRLNGQRKPIELDASGQLIDGRNRLLLGRVLRHDRQHRGDGCVAGERAAAAHDSRSSRSPSAQRLASVLETKSGKP